LRDKKSKQITIQKQALVHVVAMFNLASLAALVGLETRPANRQSSLLKLTTREIYAKNLSVITRISA
jgi:hypothetical protein